MLETTFSNICGSFKLKQSRKFGCNDFRDPKTDHIIARWSNDHRNPGVVLWGFEDDEGKHFGNIPLSSLVCLLAQIVVLHTPHIRDINEEIR